MTEPAAIQIPIFQQTNIPLGAPRILRTFVTLPDENDYDTWKVEWLEIGQRNDIETRFDAVVIRADTVEILRDYARQGDKAAD